MYSILPSPLQSQPRLSFPPFTSFRSIPNRRFLSISRLKPPNPLSLPSTTLTPQINFSSKSTASSNDKNDNVLSTHLVRALFCFAVGFSALGAIQVPPALAFSVPWSFIGKRVSGKERVNSHEYSDCTDMLLETVSCLLRAVDEVRKGNGEMSEVEKALKVVKLKKEEMRKEIRGRLNPGLKKLRSEMGALWDRAGEIVGEIVKLEWEYGRLKVRAVSEKEKARVEELGIRMGELEAEYNGILERIGEIEDEVSRKETVAYSFGVREIFFIESECEQLVERFKQEMKRKDVERLLELIT